MGLLDIICWKIQRLYKKLDANAALLIFTSVALMFLSDLTELFWSLRLRHEYQSH